MSAAPLLALIVTFPPDPHLRGRVPLACWSVSAVRNFDHAHPYSRANGPFFHQNLWAV